MIGITGTGETG